MWLGGNLEEEEMGIGGPGRGSPLRHSCQTLSLTPRHHPDQPSHEQDQRQPFSGLPVGLLSPPLPLLIPFFSADVACWFISALLCSMFL